MLLDNELAGLYMMGVTAHLQTHRVDTATLEGVLLSDKLRYSDRCAKYIKGHMVTYYNMWLVDRAVQQEHRQHYTPLYSMDKESAQITTPYGCYLIFIGETDREVVHHFGRMRFLGEELNNMGLNSLIYFKPSEVHNE